MSIPALGFDAALGPPPFVVCTSSGNRTSKASQSSRVSEGAIEPVYPEPEPEADATVTATAEVIGPTLGEIIEAQIGPPPLMPQDPGQDMSAMKEVTDCDLFAAEVARIAFENPISPFRFAGALKERFAKEGYDIANTEFASTGFKGDFRDDVGPNNTPNQVRHYVGGFRAVYLGGLTGSAIATYRERGGTASNRADLRLNAVSRRHAFALLTGTAAHKDLANMIRRDVCAQR